MSGEEWAKCPQCSESWRTELLLELRCPDCGVFLESQDASQGDTQNDPSLELGGYESEGREGQQPPQGATQRVAGALPPSEWSNGTSPQLRTNPNSARSIPGSPSGSHRQQSRGGSAAYEPEDSKDPCPECNKSEDVTTGEAALKMCQASAKGRAQIKKIGEFIDMHHMRFKRCTCESPLWSFWLPSKISPGKTRKFRKFRSDINTRSEFHRVMKKELNTLEVEEEVEEEIEEGIVEGGSGKRVRAPGNGAAGGEGGANKRRVSKNGSAVASSIVAQAPALNDLQAFVLNTSLATFRWPEHLLILFLEKEGQSLDDQKQIHTNKLLERLKSLNSQAPDRTGAPDSAPDRTGTPDSLDQLFQDFKKTLLPAVCGDGTATLTTVNDVLSYAVTHLLNSEPVLPPGWHEFKVSMDSEQFARYMKDILFTASASKPAGVLPGSVAVFFRMPSWVAKLVLYIIKRDEGVRDQVAALGYRAFALVGRAEVLPFNPSLFGGTFSGKSGAMGEGTYEGSFSLICGYNIRQCPAWVGQDGISLVDGFSPHLHRNLVDRLSREYNERVESAFDSVEDSDSEVSSEMPGGEGDTLEIASQTASRAQSRSSSLSRHSTPAAHGEAAKTMGFPGAANPFAVGAKDKMAMEASQTVDPGHEREFDAFKKLLSTCRAEMAAESELSKHADLMKLVLQEDRFRALYEFSEPRAKGGILKGRGGATRGAAPSDAKGRDRKVLQKHGARGHAHFADTSSAEETADRDVSLVEEDVGSSRPPQTSSSDSSGSSESDASSADTARPPRTSSSGSSGSSGSDASSADTAEHASVSGEEETAGSELRREIGMEQSCEEELVQRVLEELHDFGASSQWVLQVTVRQHDGKDDDLGERIDSAKIEKEPNFRLYTVDAQQLIKVTLRNLSMSNDIKLLPVYVTDTGEEEPEDMVDLKCCGEEYELPFPLQKKSGEAEDAWAIKDANGRTVLKLRFRVA